MPDYHVAEPGLLRVKGKIYRPGEQVVLSEEIAAALGAKVIPSAVAEPVKAFSEMTLKELKPLAKSAGVEAYSTKDKGELVEALEAKQPEAVTDNDGDGNS